MENSTKILQSELGNIIFQNMYQFTSPLIHWFPFLVTLELAIFAQELFLGFVNSKEEGRMIPNLLNYCFTTAAYLGVTLQLLTL